MGYRFHVLGIPHTVTCADYAICPFTQKVLKLCKILTARGHHVIHYGHEKSRVVCGEHVAVTSDADLEIAYGAHDWRRQGIPAYRMNDHVHRTFRAAAIEALLARKRRGDFLLCFFGGAHKPIADAHPDLIVCEPAIGYPDGGFARFRVFESYAVMHAYLGYASITKMSDKLWYDVVIPIGFDPEDFTFSKTKDDYFLFLGRINPGKGLHVALQIVEAIDGRLIVAGQGVLKGKLTRTDRPVSEFATYVGVVGPDERRRLLSRAKAVLTPSMYVEPFCCVQVEAMLSGTPVISTDWGAFAEVNPHGLTGYRCRTFEQFTWAARNIDRIDPATCRAWAAANFSLDRVADMYEEYFTAVHNLFEGDGWYQEDDTRSELDWLRRFNP